MARDGLNTITIAGSLLGTPSYMAPEQARGESHVDARADVFSLGCVLFECLTGRAPFAAEDWRAVLARILTEDPPPAREINPNVPEPLEAFLARMLAKERAARPANGAEVAAELARLADLESISSWTTRPKAVALTGSERRWTAMVLIDFREGERDADDTISYAHAGQGLHLGAVADRYGAECIDLGGGSVALALHLAGTATDKAAYAARCALEARRVADQAVIAVTASRSEVGSQARIASAVERGAQLLHASLDRSAIRVDGLIAALLGAEFELEVRDGVQLLRGERLLGDPVRPLLGRPTRCVGRDRELAMLHAAHAECRNERVAQIVLISGPPGVGKSRVLHEFLRGLRDGDPSTEVWRARGAALSAGSPMMLLQQLVRSAAGLDALQAAERPVALRQRLARSLDGAALEHAAQFLGELSGAVPDEPGPQMRAARNDAALMGEQIRAAFESFVAADSARQPLLFAIEDAHWGDAFSLLLLDAMSRRLHERPLLVVVTARTELRELVPHAWPRTGVKMALPPLGARACERLIREALGEVEPARVERLVVRAEGNPFCLEELIRAAAAGQEEAVPDSVLAMVQLRLDALDPVARRMLRAASVCGETFTAAALHALVGEYALERVAEWLRLLVAEELIEPVREGAYAFHHALVRDAAYATLTDRDRAVGHRLAFEWLEAQGGADPLELAEHLERAGDRVRAAPWLLVAAQAALRANQLDVAARLATRALDGGADGERRGHLLAVRAFAKSEASHWAETIVDAREAMRLLPRQSPEWYTAASLLLYASSTTGDGSLLVEVLQAVQEGEPSTDPTGPEVGAFVDLAQTLYVLGQAALAERLMVRLDRIDAAARDRDPVVAGLLAFASAWRCYWVERDAFSALRWSREAMAKLDHAGQRRGAFQRHNQTAICLGALGLYDEAEREYRAARQAAEAENRDLYIVQFLSFGIGEVLFHRGRENDARAILTQVYAESTSEIGRGLAASMLARLELSAGQLDRARGEVERALDLLLPCPPLRAQVLATRARLDLADGKIADALDAANEARGLIDSAGVRAQDEIWIRLTQAEALAAAGRSDECVAVRREAAAIVRARAAAIDDEATRAAWLAVAPNVEALALDG
jgi:tetratricopeptide (TPR) repeat protein